MSIRGVLLDIAGVLHDGKAPYPGAVEAIERLRASGLPCRFVTNTSRRTRAMTVERLVSMGFAVAEAQVFTAPLAARSFIEARGLRPLLVIHPDLAPDFSGVDTREPNAVFLADAAEFCTYELLDEAFRLLSDGAPLIAVGRNRYFRDAGVLHLDAGAYVAALEYAAGVEAVVAGKPAPAFFAGALHDLGTAAADTVMVGDDVEADVLGALDNGLQAILVRTGKYRDGDAARLGDGPAIAEADLAAAVAHILA